MSLRCAFSNLPHVSSAPNTSRHGPAATQSFSRTGATGFSTRPKSENPGVHIEVSSILWSILLCYLNPYCDRLRLLQIGPLTTPTAARESLTLHPTSKVTWSTSPALCKMEDPSRLSMWIQKYIVNVVRIPFFIEFIFMTLDGRAKFQIPHQRRYPNKLHSFYEHRRYPYANLQ